ncbi:hypothetical protein BD289DRAFT_428514 [Coniella lustricola]|uniref:Uncharacterized protein n=1 Tax=Coniella lustricola TaxID=2025994 RepID=A0A2T3ADZ7_9PEZI|nr:hypothetical protein BD289DRAFT_428514 [Coniella lustricola]
MILGKTLSRPSQVTRPREAMIGLTMPVRSISTTTAPIRPAMRCRFSTPTVLPTAWARHWHTEAPFSHFPPSKPADICISSAAVLHQLPTRLGQPFASVSMDAPPNMSSL